MLDNVLLHIKLIIKSFINIGGFLTMKEKQFSFYLYNNSEKWIPKLRIPKLKGCMSLYR